MLFIGQRFSTEWKLMPCLCFLPQSLDPSKRIGCEEMGGYEPLKQHPFFDTISWSDLHLQTPPKLTPYLPAMSEDDEDCYGNVRDYNAIQVSSWCCPFIAYSCACDDLSKDLDSSKPSSYLKSSAVCYCTFPNRFHFLSQYDDLLSQFSNMQVAQSSSSHSLSPHESTPPQRSSSNIEQYIHDLDNNSFELDLQVGLSWKRDRVIMMSAWNVTLFNRGASEWEHILIPFSIC